MHNFMRLDPMSKGILIAVSAALLLVGGLVLALS
jgi:hypothetical protein